MHLVCPVCLTINRVPNERLHDGAICAKCKGPLVSLEPKALNDTSLPTYVTNTDLPVLVDFWAEWCGPCKFMAPQFANAAQRLPDVRFIKVDNDTSPQLSVRYRIRSIPTLILFKNGAEIGRQSGAMSANDLVGWVNQQLSRQKV
jgi:thioredoxin 2